MKWQSRVLNVLCFLKTYNITSIFWEHFVINNRVSAKEVKDVNQIKKISLNSTLVNNFREYMRR